MVTFFPRLLTKTPPFALISSAASWADCQTSLPVVEAGPGHGGDDPELQAPRRRLLLGAARKTGRDHEQADNDCYQYSFHPIYLKCYAIACHGAPYKPSALSWRAGRTV